MKYLADTMTLIYSFKFPRSINPGESYGPFEIYHQIRMACISLLPKLVNYKSDEFSSATKHLDNSMTFVNSFEFLRSINLGESYEEILKVLLKMYHALSIEEKELCYI